MKKIIITMWVITMGLGSTQAQDPAIIWQKSIGGDNTDYLASTIQTFDGGYLVGGSSLSGISGEKSEINRGAMDYWVVKIDATGTKEWDKTFGGNGSDNLGAILQTSDGGYLLAGDSDSQISGDKTNGRIGADDFWIIKLDGTGNMQWQKTIGGFSSERFRCMTSTLDGGYVLGGRSSSNIFGDKTAPSFGGWDYWLIKLDANGTTVWDVTLGGDDQDEPISISSTTDGGVVVGGISKSGVTGNKSEASFGVDDYWVVKLNSAGVMEWQKTLGGSNFDRLSSVSQTLDGGYIIGGDSRSDSSGNKTENSMGLYDYWIVKLDSLGNIAWQNTIGGERQDVIGLVSQTSDGEYFVAGTSGSYLGDKTQAPIGIGDFWVLKLNDSGNILWQNAMGASGTEVMVSAFQNTEGNYVLAGHTESGMTGDKTDPSKGGYDFWMVKITEFPVGISKNEFELSLKMYPNPTDQTLHISSDIGITKISLLSSFGQEVFKRKTNLETSFELDIRAYSKGVYVVKIETIHGVLAKKVICY